MQDRLAQKAIGFLSGPLPRLPHEILLSFFAALRKDDSFSHHLPDDQSPFSLLAVLAAHSLPPSCVEAEGLEPNAHTHSAVPPTLISLRLLCTIHTCTVKSRPPWHMDTMRIPPKHKSLFASVRTCRAMQGNFFVCTGYRLLHWSPSLKTPAARLPAASIRHSIQVAAVISYYTARSFRVDNESSKLLLLTPHNDTVKGLVDALGVPTTGDQYPPSLYYYYLSMLFKIHLLSSHLASFPRHDHMGNPVTTKLDHVSLMAIYHHIIADPALIRDLEAHATLDAIVKIALDYPNSFTAYCTVSNTVKAIGIGGVASLFLSTKISDFLTTTREARARNLVALTRSKGLCVLLLPTTDKFPTSSLHFLRTLCAFRHGMFNIGAAPLDIFALGRFLIQPDVTHDSRHETFTANSWLRADQISWYGTWHYLPLALALLTAEHEFYFSLSLRTGSVPPSNEHRLEASAFESKGALPNHPAASICFARTGLILQSNGVAIVQFPFPTRNASTSLASTNPSGWTLRPTKGTFFFSAATFNQGHVHPTSSSLVDPDDEAFPANMVLCPTASPATVDPPSATNSQRNPIPDWLPQASKSLYAQGLQALTAPDALQSASPQDWLPAYCAHALSNFSEDHLPLLCTPDLLSSFYPRPGPESHPSSGISPICYHCW